MKIGTQVQTLPHTDAFMKGDRYGVVVKVGKNRLIDGRFVDPSLVRVLLDRSGDELWFHPANIAPIWCDECGALPSDCCCVAFTRDPIDPSDVL